MSMDDIRQRRLRAPAQLRQFFARRASSAADSGGDVLTALRRTAALLVLASLAMLLWSAWLIAVKGGGGPTAMALANLLLLAVLARQFWLVWLLSRANVLAHDERARLAAVMFEQSCEGIIVTDAQSNIIMVNPAFTTITGYDEVEVLGRNPRMLSAGRHDAEFYRRMWAAIDATGSWHGEIWNRRKDGGVYAEWLSITRVADESGRVQNYISICSDITERKRADEQVQRLAHHDPLTGLPNRALLTDRALQALSMAQRNAAPVAVLYMDLDHFKQINDTLGHRVGDQLLVVVAARLQSAVRDYDTVSRQGGDEFVLVLPGAAVDGAAHVAEKVRRLIADPMVIDGHQIAVTTSIGIAMFPDDGQDLEALLRAADAAMYRAKQEGRNAYRFHTAQSPQPELGEAVE